MKSMFLVSNDPLSQQRGGQEVFARIQQAITALGMQDEVTLTTFANAGREELLPLVIIYPQAQLYGPVTPENVSLLIEEHLLKNRPSSESLSPVRDLTGKFAWLKARKGSLPAQQRVVLQRAGLIDPENIEDYIIYDGYQALGRALTEMTPLEVTAEIERSGLQGRGGAGFPVGRKWSFVAGTHSDQKYVVCNADESEPGTFKDRVILESDPHSIVEAMIIAGYAVGASEGYIYIRGEYMLAQQRFATAIEQALTLGLLGENIFNSGFSFHIHMHSGAGAYICGEETALIESIEGKRGEPRSRPPYPTTHGLWGKPTLVNNVETLANIPPILRNGAEWYRQIGTPSSPGTKVYTIMGNTNLTGLIEVPMGITLREVISFYAKGMKNGKSFKLAQTGGSSGSIIPSVLQDTPMDFEGFRKAGVSLGSGALLVANEETCVVDLAKVLLKFFKFESCGKCTPCRIGTYRAHEILTGITEGRGQLSDLDELLHLAEAMRELSNCGLGQTAGVPIVDTLKYFRAEIEAHIRLGVCPTGVCPMQSEIAPITSEPVAVG